MTKFRFVLVNCEVKQVDMVEAVLWNHKAFGMAVIQ
jgi:hypothetical protein